MELQHPLLNIGSTAIAGDSICGINAKYEPSFEALEAELAKQESLTAEKVDWKEVKALATDLLQNTTKDYLVACYLAHSLNITEGYHGLLVGIKILEGFTESYWQESFPPAKRLRARKTAIEWLVEKTTQHIETSPPTNNDNEVIVEIAKSVKNLDFSLADKMDAQSPNMAELNRSLKRLKQSAEFELKASAEKAAPAAPVAEPAPAANTESTPTAHAEATTTATAEVVPIAAAAPAPIASTPAPAPATSTATSKPVAISNSALASDSDAKKLYKQVQDALRQLADFHAGQKAADPKRYRYSRAALWDSLEKLPPNKDGKTQLPKPALDKFKKLQELFDQGDFIAVLDQAEKSASKMPYWFDGQRLIANSLQALGGEFTKAADALTSELKQFLSRIPNIINLCYTDGTPFADEQTLLWIKTQVLVGDQADASDQQNDEIYEAFLEAQKLASSGKLAEGLSFLKKVSTQNLRDDYRIKLASAELVAQSGQAKVAIPLLERLINETKRINAIDWETDFTIKAYSILVQAYEKLEDDDAAQKQQQKADAFDQLCWFDPTAVAE
ncbi:MAG: type VI secretion system protein [Oleispira sp.]|nr:type VI secretion system protein [Oleispira sp.]